LLITRPAAPHFCEASGDSHFSILAILLCLNATRCERAFNAISSAIEINSEQAAMAKNLEEQEDQTFYEDSYGEVPPSDIVAYNELRSCADLFRMKSQGILDVSPDFQRDVVWKPTEQTRFIDSLLKQIPIPSMCFAQDYKAQKWIVIDGLQRISTIAKFLEGGDWKLSELDDIDQGLAGKSVAAIKTSRTTLHQYYTRIENLSIPITVLRCDFTKRNHMDALPPESWTVLS
jgi:Protein of unknown function DUF262